MAVDQTRVLIDLDKTRRLAYDIGTLFDMEAYMLKTLGRGSARDAINLADPPYSITEMVILLAFGVRHEDPKMTIERMQKIIGDLVKSWSQETDTMQGLQDKYFSLWVKIAEAIRKALGFPTGTVLKRPTETEKEPEPETATASPGVGTDSLSQV